MARSVTKTSAKSKPKPKTQGRKPKIAPPLKAPSKKPSKDAALQLANNVVVDLDAYDWGEEGLTDAQKLFVIWYSTPGTIYYHRAYPAALKAGYTQKTAKAKSYKLRWDSRIANLINKFEEKIGKVNIMETAQRWIQEKITRGDFIISDFYETEDQVNINTGETRRVMRLKSIEDLTPEQKLCIDGVDVKGQQGTMIYTLPDREKIRDSLIALANKMRMDADDVDGLEETREIIMERVMIREAKRAKLPSGLEDEIVERADLSDEDEEGDD